MDVSDVLRDQWPRTKLRQSGMAAITRWEGSVLGSEERLCEDGSDGRLRSPKYEAAATT